MLFILLLWSFFLGFVRANWRLKIFILIIYINIVREVCALEVCFSMLIKPECKEVSVDIVLLEYHWWNFGRWEKLCVLVFTLFCCFVAAMKLWKCISSSTVVFFQLFKTTTQSRKYIHTLIMSWSSTRICINMHTYLQLRSFITYTYP